MKNSRKIVAGAELKAELKSRGWSEDRWGHMKSPSSTYRAKFMTNVIRLEVACKHENPYDPSKQETSWVLTKSFLFKEAALLLARIDLIKQKDPSRL